MACTKRYLRGCLSQPCCSQVVRVLLSFSFCFVLFLVLVDKARHTIELYKYFTSVSKTFLFLHYYLYLIYFCYLFTESSFRLFSYYVANCLPILMSKQQFRNVSYRVIAKLNFELQFPKHVFALRSKTFRSQDIMLLFYLINCFLS